jgi:hypothetical protein
MEIELRRMRYTEIGKKMERQIDENKKENREKHKGRNSNPNANKRKETRSQRHNEGEKVRKTNAQVETKNHA